MLQFFLRDDKLVMHVTMRSNDAWWGTPHDWGQFSQFQLALANVLDVEAGAYYHHAVSFHLYARDFESIDKLTAPTSDPVILGGIGSPGLSLRLMRNRALSLLDGNVVFTTNETENWHREQQGAIGW